jgi:hypothetical protein
MRPSAGCHHRSLRCSVAVGSWTHILLTVATRAASTDGVGRYGGAEERGRGHRDNRSSLSTHTATSKDEMLRPCDGMATDSVRLSDSYLRGQIKPALSVFPHLQFARIRNKRQRSARSPIRICGHFPARAACHPCMCVSEGVAQGRANRTAELVHELGPPQQCLGISRPQRTGAQRREASE